MWVLVALVGGEALAVACRSGAAGSDALARASAALA